MRWPLVWRRSHDEAVASTRTVGGALSEALSERDHLLALLKTAYVRGERGRIVKWVDTEAGRNWEVGRG